jgi:hypothetical protein
MTSVAAYARRNLEHRDRFEEHRVSINQRAYAEL